ncbi:MAG: inositol monophosphatase [Patescibacteria group bacterium]
MTNEITVAMICAKEAGEYLRRSFRNEKNIVKIKEDTSPVTLCDMTSHHMIVERLRKSFPTHKIFSEESPNALETIIDENPTWVIDPLDGTSNFIADIPLFGITIAYVLNHETQLGLIYDPIHEDLFLAIKGKGSVLNDKPIHVSNRAVTKGGMLFAGRGYKQRDRDRHGEIILALEKETTYFRRLGCASVMLSSVAAGRADSVILTGSKPWDTLAGALLIEEAGGVVTDYCGKPWTYKSEDLLASNGHIHDKLMSMTCALDTSSTL